jgi:hypothetical protein
LESSDFLKAEPSGPFGATWQPRRRLPLPPLDLYVQYNST